MLIRLVGDGSSYQRMLSSAMSATRSTVGVLANQAGQIQAFNNRIVGFGQTVRNYAQGLLAVAGIGGIFETLRSSISMHAEFEKNEVAFGTMLQSMEKGTELMKKLAQFAAETPLELPTLQMASKQLLQAGIEMENIIPLLRMLGDTAGGDAQRLQQMTYAFSQVKQAGRLMGGEVFQFINAGFNPLQEMAEHLAKTLGGDVTKHMMALRAKMESGQITFNDVVNSFQRATSEGGRFAGGMLNASKTLDGLFSTMKDDIGAALREIGKQITDNLNLKDMVRDVSSLAQVTTEWIKGLDAGTKSTIIAVTAVTIGFGLLTAAILVAGVTFNTLFGSLGIVSGALITGLAAAAISVGTLVVQMGDVGKAWEWVKKKAVEAWEWLRPVRMALTSLWGALVEAGTRAFVAIRDMAVKAWQAVGGADIDWNKVRDQVVGAIIAVEFALGNIGPLSKLVWLGAAYEAVKFGNEVVWVFTDLIPAALAWFRQNWDKIHMQALAFAGAAFLALEENLEKIFKSIPWDSMFVGFRRAARRAIDGFIAVFKNPTALLMPSFDFDKVWKDIGMGDAAKAELIDVQDVANDAAEKVGGAFGKIPVFKIPERIPGEMEARIKKEYEELGKKVAGDFVDFRNKKLREFAEAGEFAGVVPPEALDPFKPLANSAAAAGKAIHDALHPSNWFSAEAITKLQQYADALLGPRTPGTPVAKAKGAGGFKPFPQGDEVQFGGARPGQPEEFGKFFADSEKALKEARETNDLLKRALEELKKNGNRPPIIFEEAGL